MPKKNKNSKSVEISKRSPKEEKLFQNLLKTTRQYVQGKRFSQMSEGELFQKLGFAVQHHDLFHEVMHTLISEGDLALNKGFYQIKKMAAGLTTGILSVHPRGFGFLQPDEPELYPQDVFIPKNYISGAVDGDHVAVQVNTGAVSEKGPEGKVVSILSRGRSHIVGIITKSDNRGYITAYSSILGEGHPITVQMGKKQPTVQVGDRVSMEVVEWGDKNNETLCRVTRILGNISDPSADIPVAIAEFELDPEFPRRVIEEAKSYGTRVSAKDIAGREDLRKIECFTIDPDTAKDFDDAISLHKDSKGHYHLGVHIADVAHYVHPGSALDDEAQRRCNSTYFPGQCLPMLPPVLSENLCSLKSNVNRLTVSVIVEFDSQGNTINYRIARTVIKSAMRFTYNEAKQVLDGKKRSQYAPTLHLMVELCRLLKKKRYDRGSIEFAIPELIVMVDKNGVPYKTQYVEYDITHQLVEEFMLKANELVALHLSQQGKNLTYRIHEEPSVENMRDFAILAAAFGFKLPDNPTTLELQKLFDEAINTAYGPYLATSYIRRMRLALYSPDNVGHYGLSLTHYCHFTSPIRRYVDLVAHRLLFDENDDLVELERISKHASERERVSARAENSVVQLKKLRYLKQLYEKEPDKQYEAVISRVKGYGFYFEIIELMVEGFIHISEIGSDYYVFEEGNMRLRGSDTGIIFSPGNNVTVMLKDIDLVLGETKWDLVAGGEMPIRHPMPPKRSSRPSSRRSKLSYEEKESIFLSPIRGPLPPVRTPPEVSHMLPRPTRTPPKPVRTPMGSSEKPVRKSEGKPRAKKKSFKEKKEKEKKPTHRDKKKVRNKRR